MKTLAKLLTTAAAVALVTALSPSAGVARTYHSIAIGAPTTQIECPGGRESCTIKNGKRVCTCLGPISQ